MMIHKATEKFEREEYIASGWVLVCSVYSIVASLIEKQM